MLQMDVVNRFLDREGRLKQMPVKRAKLEAVLDYLGTKFTLEQRYTEKEVNQILLRFDADYCTLRRFLVDTRRMGRNSLTGEYWRLMPEPVIAVGDE